MAKDIIGADGRRVGVKLSVREYNGIKTEMNELRIQNCIQAELLKRQRVVMLAPQNAQSIWHPN